MTVQSEFPIPSFSQHVELFGSVVTLPILGCIIGSVTMLGQLLLVFKHSILLLLLSGKPALNMSLFCVYLRLTPHLSTTVAMSFFLDPDQHRS